MDESIGRHLGGGAELATTGIEGLDTILGGGLPLKHVYMLRGNHGAGKTTFGIQFAWPAPGRASGCSCSARADIRRTSGRLRPPTAGRSTGSRSGTSLPAPTSARTGSRRCLPSRRGRAPQDDRSHPDGDRAIRPHLGGDRRVAVGAGHLPKRAGRPHFPARAGRDWGGRSESGRGWRYGVRAAGGPRPPQASGGLRPLQHPRAPGVPRRLARSRRQAVGWRPLPPDHSPSREGWLRAGTVERHRPLQIVLQKVQDPKIRPALGADRRTTRSRHRSDAMESKGCAANLLSPEGALSALPPARSHRCSR